MKCDPQNLIMGVLNLTPDSFSDGGEYSSAEAAINHALCLFNQGADLVDIGGESSRPGASRVDVDTEWQRIAPVLDALCRQGWGARLSVDTYKPAIMLRAAGLGVKTINDIGAASYCDQETLQELADLKVRYIAMHMHADPESMQVHPLKGRQSISVVESFAQRVRQRLIAAGFASQDIWIDPGIGFGKDDQANLALIQWALASRNSYPLVVGISRKSFMGRLLDVESPKDRDDASKMLEFSLMCTGVQAIRTHEVAKLKRIRDCWQGQWPG